MSSQILLCDRCDSGYHTACLRPPLMIIPDGEWFCPPCQHVSSEKRNLCSMVSITVSTMLPNPNPNHNPSFNTTAL